MRNPLSVSATTTPRLAGISVPGTPAPWRRLGFDCGDPGFLAGEVAIVFGGTGEQPGLAFDRDAGALEGLAAATVAPQPEPLPEKHHPNAVTGIDHVVIATPDVDRTSGALEDAGLRCLGERSATIGGRAVEQRFHHAGGCLLELVGKEGAHGEGQPSVWGVTFVTSDIDSLPALEPSPVASIRDAVQPGRRIATVTSDAGLPVRVAFMDPRPRKEPA